MDGPLGQMVMMQNTTIWFWSILCINLSSSSELLFFFLEKRQSCSPTIEFGVCVDLSFGKHLDMFKYIQIWFEIHFWTQEEGSCRKNLLPKIIMEKSRGGRFLWKISKIWAGFGPVGNTEKKIGADYEQLLRAVFSSFQGQKNVSFLKNIL